MQLEIPTFPTLQKTTRNAFSFSYSCCDEHIKECRRSNHSSFIKPASYQVPPLLIKNSQLVSSNSKYFNSHRAADAKSPLGFTVELYKREMKVPGRLDYSQGYESCDGAARCTVHSPPCISDYRWHKAIAGLSANREYLRYWNCVGS